MARQQVRLVEQGNVLAAKRVAEFAAQALRGVLAGELPDPERRVYLEFIAPALESISQGMDARKALGTWANTRAHQVPPDRETAIILAVGQELEKLRRTQTRSPVKLAIGNVAKRFAKRWKITVPVVEKTWKKAGGEDAWNAARADDTAK